ncbi:MAG: aminotransferase class V-fold PLP-dependent enzyme [Myxococcales bacterium]|nr:aminotransferase class V-fold PLP-dependent enzyme [Myxococcales bacterium]
MTWAPDPSRAKLGDRSLFEDLAPFAYLNHAAISPVSGEVRRAIHAVVDDYTRDGVDAFMRWIAQRERLRERLATLIGATPETIAFVPSTTRGVVDTAMSLPWAAGDRIVCLRGEFPTNVTPWQRAAETFGLEVVMLDVEAFRTDEGMEALRRELTRGARLVAVSAVEFQTGLAMPIGAMAEAAHAAGAELFVDAIQALGVVPFDAVALGVDYLACGSHKWLMGTEGAGFLYVREGLPLVPRLAGWLSHTEATRFLFEGAGHLRYDRPFKTGPAVFESGATNALGFAALEASVACIAAIGVDAIFAHVQRYHDALEPALVERGFASERHPTMRSGSLAVRPPEGVEVGALVRALRDRGVAVTSPDGRLRFAPHWPNALDEVPRVVAALDDAR